MAATVATFAAAYHYDLDEVNRIQAWAAPYNEHNKDTFNIVHGLCYKGLAHQLMLDIPMAEACFRKALKIAKRSGGTHSYTARLASSALGELLYERGDLDEADRLLEEGYKLGPEGGSVDFKIFRYVIAARIKALQGDRHAAGQRLDEAVRVARTLSLKRLRAMAEHERARLGLPAHPDSDSWPATSYTTRRTPVDAIDEITVQFEEASAIRMLIAADDPASKELACRWAQEWVDRTATPNAPPGVVAGASATGCLPFGRRTRRRGQDHDRHRRGAMCTAGVVALPRRRWSVRRRDAFGIAGRSAGRAVASRMARNSTRFPRSSGQCASRAADLTAAQVSRHCRLPRRQATLRRRLQGDLGDLHLALAIGGAQGGDPYQHIGGLGSVMHLNGVVPGLQ